MKLNLSPGKVKVTELVTIADELESQLEIKLKEIEELEYEIKSISDRCIQLKAKPNLIEDKPILQNNENKVHCCAYIYISIGYYFSRRFYPVTLV